MRKVRWVAIATVVALAAAWLAATSAGAGAAGEAPKATEVGITATEIHIAVVADVAAIILHGRIQFEGSPPAVADALQDAYLGGTVNI